MYSIDHHLVSMLPSMNSTAAENATENVGLSSRWEINFSELWGKTIFQEILRKEIALYLHRSLFAQPHNNRCWRCASITHYIYIIRIVIKRKVEIVPPSAMLSTVKFQLMYGLLHINGSWSSVAVMWHIVIQVYCAIAHVFIVLFFLQVMSCNNS